VGLHATMTDAGNLRVAAAVFAWLAGVIAFALVSPLWVTASLAAAALAAAAIRASPHRLRVCLVAVPVVVGIGGACYLASVARETSAATRSVHWVPLALGLDAALEAKDQTFGKHWGRSIHADANDNLRFKLRIRNSSATRSPRLTARLYAGPGQMTRIVAVSFRESEYGPFTSGPRVKVLAQSNGLDEFQEEGLRLEDPPRQPVPLESTAVSYPLGTGGFSLRRYWTVPPIAPHHQLVVGLRGSYWTPQSSQIDGGSIVEMKNIDGGDRKYLTTAAAKAGDRLDVGVRLHNSGFRSSGVFARLSITTHPRRAFDRITVFVADGFSSERKLGYGTVNSETGQPIELAVQPGTTELVGPKTDCSPETRLPLADGVAEGGLELGGIGGFHPRDPCHSQEFDRWLVFKARVLRYLGAGNFR